MAAIKKGAGASFAMATRLLVLKYRTPSPFAACASSQVRAITAAAVSSLGRPTEIFISHTDKWMQDTSKKSPMQLINEVPPIKVEGRIVACEGDSNPALGHPIEFICLDLDEPAICKYCGLRYIQDHGSHHYQLQDDWIVVLVSLQLYKEIPFLRCSGALNFNSCCDLKK